MLHSRRQFLQSALALPGLLALQSPSRPRVIVLGAGLAGLSAAAELDRAGFDVLILEARTRAGGRVYTLREPFSDGLYAEVGAARIQDSHAFTMRYVKEFNLALDPFFPTEGSAVVRVAGKRLRGAAAHAARYRAGAARVHRRGTQGRNARQLRQISVLASRRARRSHGRAIGPRRTSAPSSNRSPTIARRRAHRRDSCTCSGWGTISTACRRCSCCATRRVGHDHAGLVQDSRRQRSAAQGICGRARLEDSVRRAGRAHRAGLVVGARRLPPCRHAGRL